MLIFFTLYIYVWDLLVTLGIVYIWWHGGQRKMKKVLRINVLNILGPMCKRISDVFLPPISRQVYFIAAGHFHTPHQGGLLSLQINTRNCIYLDTYAEVGVVLLEHMYFKLFFGAASCQLQMKRPPWCSARCFSPPGIWMNALWRLKFWPCCILDDLPLPSDVCASLLSIGCHSWLLLLRWVAGHCPQAAVLLAAALRWKREDRHVAIRSAVEPCDWFKRKQKNISHNLKCKSNVYCERSKWWKTIKQ